MNEAKVPDKCYRLTWNLNKNTKVQVKTAAGISGTAVTGRNLGQGSKSAGAICSMSLSKSVSNGFSDSKHETWYGEVELSPILYQDDGMKASTTIEGARDGLKRFEKVMDSKTLEVSTEKSIYMLIGPRKNVSRIRDELSKNPLTFNGKVLKEKRTEKWLGEIMNTAGSKETIFSSLQERKLRIAQP